MKVTNNAQAPRGINVMVGKTPTPTMLLLQPGETQDVILVNPEDKVFLGMVQTRDLLVQDSAVEKAAEKQPAAPVVAAALPFAPTKEAVDPKAVPDSPAVRRP